MLRLLLVVFPLGLDTLAVSAALGVAGLPPARRLRTSAVFTAFEVGMPLIGLLLGRVTGQLLGGVAGYIAVAALAGVGAYMIKAEEEPDAGLIERSRGLALLGLGLGLSLDELAIGFSLGLLGVPIVPAVILIGAQAFGLSQAGLRLGGRVGATIRDRGEKLAGLALVTLALVLLALRLSGHGG